MPEQKHTPGPWFIGGRLPHQETKICTIVGGEAVHGSSAAVSDWRADAALISTAPDLLADLIEAASTLRRYEALHRAKNTDDSLKKAEVNAELALRFERTIAKVTP
ncbi:hypothetical protein [Pseudomonas sp. p106]|uniref:hypothetical protein n=1 Tax=Pseudomonas sp. p106 TaxID=2479854 RepID=UPI000F7A0384|nr:hypothetical protein [Pseudomonas sp. p106]